MRFMYLIVRMLVLLSLAACFALSKSSVVEKREVENRGIASDLNGVSPTGSIPSFSFVRIPAVKEFMMGSPKGEPFRDPRDEAQVPVEISKAFMMMTTEVTQRQYFQVTGKRPSRFKAEGYCPGSWDRVNHICPDHPVEGVNWYETQDFIKELNRLVGLRGCNKRLHPRVRAPYNDNCYRLPTEAEWEWAVRAGTKTAYFFGNDSSQLGRYAVYRKNSGGRTYKVRGNRLANPWGLYDVYGNVWEWVQDAYSKRLPGGTDPLVTYNRSARVLRGGSWGSNAEYLRSAHRGGIIPGGGGISVGFRLVRTL